MAEKMARSGPWSPLALATPASTPDTDASNQPHATTWEMTQPLWHPWREELMAPALALACIAAHPCLNTARLIILHMQGGASAAGWPVRVGVSRRRRRQPCLAGSVGCTCMRRPWFCGLAPASCRVRRKPVFCQRVAHNLTPCSHLSPHCKTNGTGNTAQASMEASATWVWGHVRSFEILPHSAAGTCACCRAVVRLCHMRTHMRFKPMRHGTLPSPNPARPPCSARSTTTPGPRSRWATS